MAAHTPKLLTASELSAAYRSRELSPVEATQASLAAIAAQDSAYNAYVLVDSDAALAQAKAAEQRWFDGAPIGPLDGVPSSIKDMFLSKGWPTLRGSACVDPEQPWEQDSPVTAHMRENGLVLLGKTTTPELGWKALTDSPRSGITRNPYDPSLTPGGSSGGSAVAVATGMGELSVGTDAGGSVRVPGAFCGVVGFKPTQGRIPLYPASAFGSLAHAGPMTRSVSDAALLMDVLGVPDHRDPTALPQRQRPFNAALSDEVRGLRAAFSPTLGYLGVDGEVAHVVSSAVAALDAAGLVTTEADPGFGNHLESFDRLWATGAAKALEAFGPDSASKLDQGLRRMGERGRACGMMEYLAALAHRAELGIHMGEFHTRYDVLLSPAVGIQPFEAGHDVPPGSGMTDWPEWAGFSFPFNLTQQPAISVPCGFTSSGLPVGLQIVGPRHADHLVLAVARLFEDIHPWDTSRPAAPAAPAVSPT